MKKLKTTIQALKIAYRISPLDIVLWNICTVLLFASTPIYSLLEKYLYDTIQKVVIKGDADGIRLTIIGLLAFFLCYNLIVFLASKLQALFEKFSNIKLSASMHKRVMKTLTAMPFDNFEDNEFYNSIDVIAKEVDGSNLFNVNRTFFSLVSGIITLFSLIIILQKFSWIAVIISIICCIPGFLHQSKFGELNWKFNTTQIPIVRKNNYLFQLLSSKDAYMENHLFQTIPVLKKRFQETQDQYYKELKFFNKEQCWKGLVMATLHSIGTVGVIAYAYISAAKGLITLGEAVLFVGVSQSIYNILQNLIYYWGSYVESINIVSATIKYTKQIEKDGALNEELILEPVSMEIKDLVYKYPKSEKTAIDHISFNIKKNEKIAIVGENGSGKTTLAKLLLGLYEYQNGKIEVNGTSLKDYKKELHFGTACFQNYHTYNISIRENIGFGYMEKMFDDSYLIEAANNSGLFGIFTESVSLDTYLQKDFSEDGICLSGGQLQKMSLARAFASPARFLVLDEPSASLDIFSENEIFERSLNLMKDKTVIIITHRLSNVLQADKIIYLQDGRIEEMGTHEQLITQNGKYASLFKLQAEQYLSVV